MVRNLAIGKGAIVIILCLIAFQVHAENKPRFTENKGQLPENVFFKLKVANADVFFEKGGLTFNFYDPDLSHHHGELHSTTEDLGHAYRVEFLDASPAATCKASGAKYSDYENFIFGETVVGHVRSYEAITMTDVYPNVDFIYYGKEGNLKYDVVLRPGADPWQIKMKYDGADAVFLSDGNLMIWNTFNNVEESIPLAYQIIGGEKRIVACEYRLDGEVVSFQFPNGYDSEYELVIDPTLIFASYTGSTANNFGFTATYDDDGALYGGGIAFGLGYPTVSGSYSQSFGGVIDMAISKFVPDGTSLEYSTYIGGSSADVPHSMIVNSQGQLVILGTTSSPNFPVSVSGFDQTFNGGSAVNYTSNGTNFQNGSDIVVTVLSADGSSLVGSTFLGGSQNDGLNEDNILSYNYGDIFRGEVNVDASDNIYIASSTRSSDFPVSTNALGQTLGGTQDGCLAKFNSDVSVLEWCTYIGGSSGDAGYSVKVNSTGEVYMTGGTSSQDLPLPSGSLHSTYQGGTADGFIIRVGNDGNTLLNGSYLGTSLYDQSYFVEIDGDDDVYTYGQSAGSYPVTGGTYFNLNGRQFIQKLTPDLSTSVYSTIFGSGSANVNISPTAFLVDICERVFISGWGGNTNNSWNSSTGNTVGLPLTSDAVQQSTDGSDFYFMVLEADATSLLYGSYFGGSGLAEHVDGGTSRFNSNGVIHQAACAGCGGSNAFPTTPGVVSQINGNSCNLGVVKLDLEITAVQVEIESSGNLIGCAPFEATFNADLINATNFVWYFGDGDTSHLQNPTHIYTDSGEFEVMLIGTDTSFCTGEAFTDTAIVTVTVSLLTDAAEAGTGGHLCPGDSVAIGADVVAGYGYSWSPTNGLSSASTAEPFAFPLEDTWYHLTITNPDGCEDTDSVLVTVFNIDAYPDTSLCLGDSVMASVSGGSTFSWSPTVGVSDPAISNPYITAGSSESYTVTASDGTCQDTATIFITSVEAPEALFDVEISQSCLGDSVRFFLLQDYTDGYHWNIGGYETDDPSPVMFLEPDAGPIVTLTVSNNGGTCIDSLTIDYSQGWFNDDSLAVKYPNVFTPNGDGINDCFKPHFIGDLDDCFTLKVFSRWGRLLYDSEKMGGNCWDGMQRTDELVSEGTYYYIANVRGMDHAGYVTVLYK